DRVPGRRAAHGAGGARRDRDRHCAHRRAAVGVSHGALMLFADLVGASAAVAATPRRAEKVAHLAELLRRLAPDEGGAAVAFLSGELPSGRIGVGWSTLARSAAAGSAAAPELAIRDVTRFLDEVLATVGAGSSAARARQISAFSARATAAEVSFLERLL